MSNMSKHPVKPAVLVTQIRYKQSIAIMKSLQAAGFRIYGGDNMRFPSGRFSRYCHQSVRYRCPIKQPDHFIDDVIAIANKYHINTIVPGFSEIVVLAKNIERLEQAGIRCLVDDFEKIANANNKSWVTKKANELGIATPKTWHPCSISDVEVIANSYQGRTMIKALSGKGGEDLIVVDHIDQLVEKYKKHIDDSASSEWPIVQELIDIESTYCTAYLFDHGRLIAEHSYTVTRTLNNGIPIDRSSQYCPELLRAGRELLAHMEWHGIAQVDFIIEKASGRPCLLEINPRFWASVSNAVSSGVDFPKMVMMLNESSAIQAQANHPFTTGVRTIWFFPFMVSFMRHLKQGNWHVLKQHAFNPFSPELNFDDISIRDPLPALVEPFIGLYFLLKNGSLRQD